MALLSIQARRLAVPTRPPSPRDGSLVAVRLGRWFAGLLLIVGAGSAAAGEAAPGKATLTGRIESGAGSQVTLNCSSPPISDGWSVSRDPDDRSIPVDAEGSFSFDLPLDRPRFCRLTAADQTVEILLAPGAVSRLKIDGASVEFSGDHAAGNRYLRELASHLAESERSLGRSYRALFSRDPAAFARSIDPLEEASVASLSP